MVKGTFGDFVISYKIKAKGVINKFSNKLYLESSLLIQADKKSFALYGDRQQDHAKALLVNTRNLH